MPVDSELKEVRDPAALALFKSIGLDAKTAANAVANSKVTANHLTNVVHEAGVGNGCYKSVGNLLYTVATKFPADAPKHRPDLCRYITQNEVHTEVFFSDGTILRPHNPRDRLEEHLQETGGKFFTRFPPEPNGYLHIGHAKAMLQFGLAKESGGNCYLSYYCVDRDSSAERDVFNRTVTLRDSYEPTKLTSKK